MCQRRVNFKYWLYEFLRDNNVGLDEFSRTSDHKEPPTWSYVIKLYHPPNAERYFALYSGTGSTIDEAKHDACKKAYLSKYIAPLHIPPELLSEETPVFLELTDPFIMKQTFSKRLNTDLIPENIYYLVKPTLGDRL